MLTNATFSERLRYRVDNFMARGSGALFLALLLTFISAIVLLSLFRWALNLFVPEGSHLLYQVWVTFLELTDAGNMNQDNATPPIYKLAAAIAGFVGMVTSSSVVAFVITVLDQSIRRLRKGYSRVLEVDHTLIVGWSPRVVEILHELAEANASRKDAAAVILADHDKEEMDDHLKQHFTNRRTTRVVTRRGPAAALNSLLHVNACHARSAILLANCGPAASTDAKDRSDAQVIKAALAMQAYGCKNDGMHIVAEVFDPANRPIVEDLAPGRAVVIDTEDVLARIIVQTSRTSGLSVVYSELLSFFGCEMYFYRASWGNARFGELQYRFSDGVPIGLARADGRVVIQPSPDTVLNEGDQLLLVAQDDSAIQLSSAPVAKPKLGKALGTRLERRQERILILGWSAKAPSIIRELANYVLDGSAVNVMLADPSDEIRARLAQVDADTPNLSVRLVVGKARDRDALAAVDPLSYDAVLLLQQHPSDDVDPDSADAETLVVLLHLRKLVAAAEAKGRSVTTKIVTEVLESSNQDLINQTGVNDFIISNRLISMIFAQLSEEPRLKTVYDTLFAEAGSEIYVKPASLYFDSLPVTCRFVDLMGAAQTRDGEVCIGYKLLAHQKSPGDNYGVQLVPDKNTTITLTENDALVVVAVDEL